ncbi:MAG: M48 family metallopeptidase [Sphingomonadales bacterium]
MQKFFISFFLGILFFGLITSGDNLSLAQEAFDADAATEAYLASVPAEDRAKSDAYFEGGYWLGLWNTLYGIAAAFILLHFGISRKMRDWGEKITRFKFFHRFAYVAQYFIASFIISFPLTWYQGLLREQQYDLATQTFGPWFWEQLISLGVGIGLFGLALTLLYTGIARKPKTWWVWGGGGVAVFIMFTITISPVFISPLFNDYKPLEDGEVRTEILSMARANLVPAEEVYWFDASKQTTRISANVSGMFGTTRISLNDNLLNGATLPEIKAVMAHEIAHYVTNIIIALVIPISLIIMLGFAFVHVTFNKVNEKYGARWGVKGISDPAGLPIFAALISVYFLVISPLFNTVIRENERMADAYALNAAREPDAAATIALKLGAYRKLDPSPLEEFIFFDHPSGRSRIQMAMEWKAEHLGEMADEPALGEE